METVTIYLDTPLLGGLFGWIQDTALLWMVGQITSYYPPFRRYIIGGLVGGLFQFMVLMYQMSSGLLFSWVLSPLLYMVVLPGMMLGIVFFPVTLRKMTRLAGYFYLLSFLLAGIHWGVDSLNQRFFLVDIGLGWRFWLHLMFIFILGELGWGVIHQKIWEQVCLYPVTVRWDGHEVKLTALLDTGNTLIDPLTRHPVVIVELDRLQSFLPPELIRLTQGLTDGQFSGYQDVPEGWEKRFRLLPFHAVGQSGGMMVGFRPDVLEVYQKNQRATHRNVVVALHQSRLSPEGLYQGLIPPVVLNDGGF